MRTSTLVGRIRLIARNVVVTELGVKEKGRMTARAEYCLVPDASRALLRGSDLQVPIWSDRPSGLDRRSMHKLSVIVGT